MRKDSSQLRVYGNKASIVCGGPRVEGCGRESRRVKPPSPAAPTLTIVAALKASGEAWECDVGYWPMLLGHSVLCPACASRD